MTRKALILIVIFIGLQLDHYCAEANRLQRVKPDKKSTFQGWEIGYFAKTRVLYREAVQRCQRWRGTLVAIKSEEKQRHIVNNMPKKRNCKSYFFYMGLVRYEDHWRWPDKTTFREGVNYSNWRVHEDENEDPCSREPNGYKTCLPPRTVPPVQNATQISACLTAETSTVGDWFDKDGATSSWYYICERPQNRATKPSTTSAVTNRIVATTLTPTLKQKTQAQENDTTQSQKSTVAITQTYKDRMTTATSTLKLLPNVATTAFTNPTSLARSSSIIVATDQMIHTTELLAVGADQVITTPSAEQTTNSEPVTAAQQQSKMDKCLTELLAGGSGMTVECALSKTFGEDFDLNLWEENISQNLGRLFLMQNDMISRTINFPGITISLFKGNSQTNLSEIFNVSTEAADRVIIPFDSEMKSQNSFLVNLRELSKIPRPFSVVTAEIKPSLQSQKYVKDIEPLRQFNSNATEIYDWELNSFFNTLPSAGSILSFKLYVPSENSSEQVTPMSIPVEPFVSIENDDSVSKVEQTGSWKIPFNGVSYSCRFLHTSSSGVKSWSTEGCFVERIVDKVVHCNCNHTTSFGVIVAVRTFYIPPAVTVVALALEVLTILALALTVILLLWLRKRMHSDRTVMQINLAFSLLLAHVFLILGDSAVRLSEPSLCIVCAVFSQFFIITTAFWMLNEGIVLVLKTYKTALSFNVKKVFPYLALVAWGLPLVYVAVCAGVGINNDIYLDKKNFTTEQSDFPYARCWVGVEHKMIYTVVVPVFLVLAITTGIVIKTSIAINKMSKEVKRMQPSGKSLNLTPSNASVSTHTSSTFSTTSHGSFKAKKATTRHAMVALRAVILLLPVLGITWWLAFFVNIPYLELPFVIIHSVISGLQGVFIFYIYCIQNSHFRRVFDRKWRELSSSHMGTDLYSQRSSKHHSNIGHSQFR